MESWIEKKNSLTPALTPSGLEPPGWKPAPQGEGETIPASLNHSALDSHDGHSENLRHAKAVPSPRGRGLG